MSKTNWGAVVIDLAIITAAVYTGVYAILFLCLLTGSYQFSRSNSDDES